MRDSYGNQVKVGLAMEQVMERRSEVIDISQLLGDEARLTPEQHETLDTIQRRLLWLSTAIIHHANHVRPNVDGLKVGGHQASSASVASIITALYFHALQRGDRVAIKPHASPIYHAAQYMLGNLDADYLTTLREYGGLQSYPSRTKDPDPVDFSTGSVGLGAVAPLFSALAHRYAQEHFGEVTSNRFIALVGDAELDEGNVWEALIEEATAHVGNVLWIVDLNRQSLDRVIPGIRAQQTKQLFIEAGWRVLEAKYGSRLREVFAWPGGQELRKAIDEMSNEEYQTLIRLDGATLRTRLLDRSNIDRRELERAVNEIPDEELPSLLANLGGHDLGDLVGALEEGLRPSDQPTVLFAYTIKGWNLPFAGDSLNHSALLNAQQLDPLREALGVPEDEAWTRFKADSAEGQLAAEMAARLYGEPKVAVPVTADMIPEHIGASRMAQTSTQEALGRLLTRLADLPGVGERIITTAPDVSVSTNLGGWINKVGVYSAHEERVFDDTPRLLKWEPKPTGQHIELGISEMNLFMLLGALGLSHELSGQLLFPIGTVYDPFVCRGLDAFIYGLYSQSKFIVAGTPAGLTLAPEGGAHQSTVTPSLGIELPHLRSYEPAFAQELEWFLLEGLRKMCDRERGRASYLRLSTRTIDQRLLDPAIERLGVEELRRQALVGAYRLVDAASVAPDTNPADTVHIVASGAVMPEAVEAARLLHAEGVAANVINATSPQRLYQQWVRLNRWRMGVGGAERPFMHLDALLSRAERRAPIVTVQDGASHALSFLGSVYGTQIVSLGVDEFGQSGSLPDLYRHYGLDAEHIATAAYAVLDQRDGVVE